MFPHLKNQFLLDRNVTFLNHGSFGACAKPVYEDLLNWQLQMEREPVKFFEDTIFDALLISFVLIPVLNGIKSFRVLIAITISSRAALPALSPIPLIVHSICLAPATTPAKEFATAKPKSLWQ